MATRPPKRIVRCSTVEQRRRRCDGRRSSAVALLREASRRPPCAPCRNAVGSRVPTKPRGFQIMIDTMARPNSSMRYWVGSKSGPKICLRKSSSRRISVPPIMHDRRDRDADQRAHAAEHDDGQDDRRFQEDEGFRADEALARGEERAGEAAEHRADRERGELGVGGVDAERAAGDLVLAQRFPGAADRQAAQADRDEGGQQREQQDQVVEEDRAVDAD